MKRLSIRSKLIIYAMWLIASFGVMYVLISQRYFISWQFFSTAFLWYVLLILPLSLLGAYWFMRPHVTDIYQRAKILIVLAGILLVGSFTLIQWATLTTRYGNIEAFQYDRGSKLLMLDKEAHTLSLFERKTLYLEAITSYYDLTFQKIWIFDGIIFVFSFLILRLISKTKETEHLL